jgi:uncharacterized protein (UPF0332 family)
LRLASELLELAGHLAKKEKRRPKQASLRRAVSTAYYALFHLAADGTAARLIPAGGTAAATTRRALRRLFNHGEMKEACDDFRNRTPTKKLKRTLGTMTVPKDIRDFAAAFVQLQQARHEADYDAGRHFSRQEVLDLVEVAQDAMNAWDRAWRSEEARLFMVALLGYKRFR